MKILVAKNKYGEDYYRFTTPHEQAASALALFKANDGLSYYTGIEDDSEIKSMESEVESLTAEIAKAEANDISPAYVTKLKSKRVSYTKQVKEDKIQHDLYVKAKAGDSSAALKLITLRQDAEYEGWEVKEVR